MGTASLRVVVTHALDHNTEDSQVSQHLVESLEVRVTHPSSCRSSSHLEEKQEGEGRRKAGRERERGRERGREKQREGGREGGRKREREREKGREIDRACLVKK